MNQAITFNANLQQLNKFAENLAAINKPSDIILLQGELGTGKTTFTRFWINALYQKKKISPPFSIKSPTFPIMISYNLNDYEVYHYDLYRLKNKNELQELNIIENLKENITLIEWPQIILNSSQLNNYFFINIEIISANKRMIEINHTYDKHFDNDI